jgi:hypothetical protein
VKLADLNNDGKLDIVATNASSNTVSVLLGNGSDVNNDGTSDVVALTPGSNSLQVTLGEPSTVTLPPTSTGANLLTTASAESAATAVNNTLSLLQSEDSTVNNFQTQAQNLLTNNLLTSSLNPPNPFAVADLLSQQMQEQGQLAVLAQANLDASLVANLLKF